jgi:hypothetical protein
MIKNAAEFMKNTLVIVISLTLILSLETPTFTAEEPPPWAYPVNPPDFKARSEDGIARRVLGSSVTYSVTQLRDRFIAPVWHPDDQPPLPEIVATGSKPNALAWGFVSERMDQVGRRTPDLRVFPPLTLSNKWRITRAV